MTSANVIIYKVFRNGEEVGELRQHVLCKDRSKELLKYLPLEEHSIQATWEDEEEEYYEGEVKNLLDFLSKFPWFKNAGKVLPQK
jgi:hypothetical protein